MASSKLSQLTGQLTTAQIQARSKQSVQWLMKKISEIRNPSTIARGIKSERNREVNHFVRGGLYCFYYDPKMKYELDYYDKFPLVLVLEKYTDGFLGLNLHYLPIRHRVALMDKLMDFAVMRDDDILRMRVTYDILAATTRYREFKPCVKKYLYPHLKSKILTIQPNEWEVAVFLPMHQFKGAKPQQIWQESLDQIKGMSNGGDNQ
jgi:hypothetical protein